jgi:hypothetical protein
MKRWLASLLGSALCLPLGARADFIPPCPAPANVVVAAIPSGLPGSIVKDLATRYGVIAEPGQEFDATDIATTGIRARYIFGWQIGASWVVALEHGGRGYNDPVLRYEASPDGTGFRMAQMRSAVPLTVCRTASALAQS